MADERNQQSGGAQQSEAEAFLPELERLTVLRFKLHKHLLEVIRYLGAYDDVGIDVDNVRSGEMAICQHHLLIGEIREATECTVGLPQSERVLQILTALTMARQILEIAGTQAQNALEDSAGNEAVIRYIREAVLRAHNEIANPLNHMAAEVLTQELGSELRDRTEAIKQQIVVAQFLKAGNEWDDKPTSDEWSRPMSLSTMATILGLPSADKVKSLVKARTYQIRPAGNRQTWQIHLAGIPSERRKKLV